MYVSPHPLQPVVAEVNVQERREFPKGGAVQAGQAVVAKVLNDIDITYYSRYSRANK